jgi:hypothetical protein
VTRDRLWTLLAVLIPVLGATLAPMSTVDLAYQVRVGDLMRASGSILSTDPLTFSAAGQPWLNQQWSAGLLLSVAYSVGGWAGLALLRALLVGLVVGLVFWTSRRWLTVRPAALFALGAFVVGMGALALRAQLFGLVCFVLVIALLTGRRTRPRLAFAVPLVVLVWANLHGSFFLGVGATGLALLADLRAPTPVMRRGLAVLVLTAAASVVTPFGAGSWSYALGLSTNADVARLVTEWQRTSPLTFDGGLFYLAMLLAILVLAAVRRRERWLPSAPGLLWLGGLAVVGAWAERGIVWWAFGASVVLAPALARLRGSGVHAAPHRSARPEPPALRRLNLGIAMALVALVVLLQPVWRPSMTLAGPAGLLTDAPVGLAAAMRASGTPSDRAMVPQRWASWFEWAAPGVPVMVDSRIEVVPPSAWADYLLIASGGPGTLDTLGRIGASVVVVDRRGQGALLLTLEASDSGWRIVAQDGDGSVFRPTGSVGPRGG